MIYNISAGAIELPQVPEYRPSHCLHRAAPAPAMRRLSICWLAKQFDSAEVTRKEPARINTRNTPAKRRECCGSRSFENALRRCGGIAAGAAATDSFAPPKTFRTDTLSTEYTYICKHSHTIQKYRGVAGAAAHRPLGIF